MHIYNTSKIPKVFYNFPKKKNPLGLDVYDYPSQGIFSCSHVAKHGLPFDEN